MLKKYFHNIRVKIVFIALAWVSHLSAFNEIHFDSYNLVPSPIYHRTFNISTGLNLNPDRVTQIRVPFAGVLNLTPDFELGSGVYTMWGGGGNLVTHWILGGKGNLGMGATLQISLVAGLNEASNGLSIHYQKFSGFSKHFSNYSQIKLGVMEHFAGNNLLAAEAGVYPTLEVINPLTLQWGFIASSRLGDFEQRLAMDMLPTLRISLQGGAQLSLGLAMGLAGNNQSGNVLQLAVDFSL